MKRRKIGLLVALAFLSWLPRIGAAEPFFFIQLSDPQMGMFNDNKDFAQDAANFEFAVTAVNRLHPAFVVVTGDLVNKSGDAAQIAEYRRILGKIDPSIPVHSMAGNHDVGNMPTPATIAAYTQAIGPDHYTFRHQGLAGIVLNSTVIHTPQQVTEQLREQDRWLRAELARAKAEGAAHIVVFQHHPWFIAKADEPDQYFNIPLVRRTEHLALFREFGVRYLFCGHYHRNAEGRDGDLQNITTGPVGKPLGGAKSGFRVAIVRDNVIEHRYYELGELPTKIELTPPAEKTPAAKK
ncbi:MAG: metallophosphoesterase [Verrucomicrobia bacterium]|nr:metallophosphoesterase [Verrucomicrobiota bacterium]